MARDHSRPDVSASCLLPAGRLDDRLRLWPCPGRGKHLHSLVVDRDHSALSRDYLYRFVESRYFSFQGELPSENEADAWLQSGKITGCHHRAGEIRGAPAVGATGQRPDAHRRYVSASRRTSPRVMSSPSTAPSAKSGSSTTSPAGAGFPANRPRLGCGPSSWRCAISTTKRSGAPGPWCRRS